MIHCHTMRLHGHSRYMIGIQSQLFGSCDFDLNPMTLIYGLHLYPLKVTQGRIQGRFVGFGRTSPQRHALLKFNGFLRRQSKAPIATVNVTHPVFLQLLG